MSPILLRGVVLGTTALLLGACARGPAADGGPAPVPAPAVAAAATPHGDWTFTMHGGDNPDGFAGSMRIGRDPGASRITITELGLSGEPVHQERLEMEADGAFTWRGVVAGTPFVMRGRVEGAELRAEAVADGLGRFDIRGRRAAGG